MNLDGTRPNPGKTRVYLQKSRFTRKIPGRFPTNVCRARRHIAFSQGQATPAKVRAPFPVLPLCVSQGGCGEAAGAACRWQCGRCGCDADVLLQDHWRCLACTSAIPISSSQRSSSTSWLLPTRPYATSRADRSKRTHAEASLTCVCLSLENCFFG